MSDKPRLVIVSWDDANCLGVWADSTHWVEPSKCETVGWLHRDEEGYVQLVATLAEDGQYNQSMTIPRGMVKDIRDVETGNILPTPLGSPA
jgi:hypothetical protein